MMRIKNMNQLKRNENSRIRKIDNNYYILSGRDCYQINEIGALIINAVGKDLTINMACEKLSVMYNNPDVESIVNDVHKFINFIIENKIVEGSVHGDIKNV